MTDAGAETWLNFFDRSLEAIKDRAQYRARSITAAGACIDFGSNDYLGLRHHPGLQLAVQDALRACGWGSGASPVLRGFSSLHASLEQALAQHCQAADALVFTSGYACNIGTLAALADEQTLVYSDELNHASLIDGIRLSKAKRVVYPHLELSFLERHLRRQRHDYARALIVSESVFSMDGDIADLNALLGLAANFNCGLIIDEAHATGVYGPGGAGKLAEIPSQQVDSAPLVLKLGTLSKAVGSIGGFVAGPRSAIDFLVNRCRSYLFSTAPPAASMAASLAGLQFLRGMDAARESLRSTSAQLREELRTLGWEVPLGDSPIVPLIVGSEVETLRLSQRLRNSGIFVPAIRPPTVTPGKSRLRISLSTRHTQADLQTLLNALVP